jgi:hypothetical protein
MSPLGRCDYHEVVWEWHGKPLLRDACCAYCGLKLARTTRRIKKYPIREAQKGRNARGRLALMHRSGDRLP